MSKPIAKVKSHKRIVDDTMLERYAWFSIIVFGIILLYQPVGGYDMINWDEKKYLLETPFVLDLNFENIRLMFTQKVLASYNPLVLLSFSIDHQIAGQNWGWYHLVNVTFHLLNTFLLFACLRKMKLSTGLCGLVSSFFAFHPMAVEAVAWIAGRKDVLYVFFYLLSVHSYLIYRERGKTGFFILSVFLGLLSCLSKVQAITLPVVLLVIDYIMHRKITKNDLLTKIPYFVLASVFGLINVTGTTLVADKYSIPPTFTDKVMYSVMAFGMYVEKLVFPFNLSVIHDFPEKESGNYWLMFGLGIVLLALFALVLIKGFKKYPWVTGGLLLFMVQIFPVLHLVGYNSALIYERFNYLASVGIFVAIAKADEVFPKWNYVRMRIMIPALAIFGVITTQRIPVWKNPETLWTDAIKKNPKAEAAFNNRGQYYDSKGEYEKALADFNSSIELEPNKPDAWNNKCVYYFKKKDWDNALRANDRVLAIEPRSVEGLSNRGGIFFNKENYDSALYYYGKIITIAPTYASAYYNIGASYMKMNQLNLALENLKKAIFYSPSYTSAHTVLALTYARLEKADSAQYHASVAEKLNPNAGAYRSVAVEYLSMGNKAFTSGNSAKALEYYLSAAQADPGNPEGYYNAGGIYLTMQNVPKARECWQQAVRINPQHQEARSWLIKTGGIPAAQQP